jgi:excisionase family DNA binding protein
MRAQRKGCLTTTDVAEELSVTTDQVVALIRVGRLRAVNVGIGRKPRWRIDAEALDQFIEAQTAPVPPSEPAPRKRKKSRPVDVIEFF